MVRLLPNRYGPFQRSKHSCQILRIQSMSACAADHTTKLGLTLLRLTGSAERSAANPECISPQIERQRARASGSFGSKPALGLSSLRYSPIASVSQIEMPLWIRVGTRIDEDCSSSSARTVGSSADTICSSKSSPAHFAISQPRRHHDERSEEHM